MNNLKNTKLNNQEIKENKTILNSHPQEIWLSVTNKCNLNCSHCKLTRPEKENMRQSKRVDIDDKLFEKIKTQVFPFINKVVFGGTELSEQLFNKNWDYIFDQTAKFPLDIHIITNGTLLTQERIKKFIDREVTLSVSIESCRRELYEIMRGRHYDKVFDLIKQGCELKKKLKKDGAVIKFGVTLFRDNIYEIPQMLEYAKNIGISEINSNHFCPQFEYQREQSLVYHKDVYNEIYDASMEKAGKLGINLDMPPKFYIPTINEAAFERAPVYDKNSSCCYLPWSATSIDQVGKITPCCGAASMMGDLNKKDFLSIWNGKKYQILRETVNTDKAPDYCRNCVTRAGGRLSDSSLLSNIGAGSGFSMKRLFFLNLREGMIKNKITKPIYEVLEKVYKKIY